MNPQFLGKNLSPSLVEKKNRQTNGWKHLCSEKSYFFRSMFDYKLFKISTLRLGRNTKDWKKTNLGESLILVKILRILLWRQTGWNDAWSEEDLICGVNVSEVCQPRDCKMYLTVVKVGEVLVGILFALVKATFWGLFSVVWVAMFYVLIVNVHSVLYFYAQTWWDSDLHLKTKHWESLGSYSKPFICSMRWITQTSLIVITIKVNWLRLESV